MGKKMRGDTARGLMLDGATCASIARMTTGFRFAGWLALTILCACDKSEAPTADAARSAAASASAASTPSASAAASPSAATSAAAEPSASAMADSDASAAPSASARASSAKGTSSATATASAEPSATAVASVAPSSEPAPVASGQAASKPEYSAWLQGPKKIKVGETASLSAVFTAGGKYHCNEKYPTSFKPDAAPAGVTFTSDKFSGAAFGTKRSSVPVSLSASGAGAKTVTGTLKFGVCDESECIPVKAPVSFTFEVE
jgi:hypothetical protein